MGVSNKGAWPQKIPRCARAVTTHAARSYYQTPLSIIDPPLIVGNLVFRGKIFVVQQYLVSSWLLLALTVKKKFALVEGGIYQRY